MVSADDERTGDAPDGSPSRCLYQEPPWSDEGGLIVFKKLIEQVLGELSKDLQKQLLNELKTVAKKYLADKLIATLARNLLKGIDTVIAQSVKLLSTDQVLKLTSAYAGEVDRQLVQLNKAVATYIPLQLDVELAKKQ